MADVIAVIEWLDASYDDGPLSLDELDPCIVLHTVGWLLREDRTSVTVAMERGADWRYRSITHIPRKVIRSIRKLKP